MKHRRLARFVLPLAAAIYLLPAAGFAESTDESFASDPVITIKYLPGKYFEQMALLAIKREDFRTALEKYEEAGYWGNKIAQYNVAMLYLNGAVGVPIDKVRGVAWLGIAAQTHAPDVDKALGAAYAGLAIEQRAAADALWKQLKVDYDDKVTLNRASIKFNAQYMRDKGQIYSPPEYAEITYGNFDGAVTAATVTGRPDSHTVNAAKFFAAVKDQFSDFVRVQFGAVAVGEPESISEHDAPKDGSHRQ